jgi:hypothetical protein
MGTIRTRRINPPQAQSNRDNPYLGLRTGHGTPAPLMA